MITRLVGPWPRDREVWSREQSRPESSGIPGRRQGETLTENGGSLTGQGAGCPRVQPWPGQGRRPGIAPDGPSLGTGRSELQDPVHEGSVWAAPSVDPTAPAPPASAPNLCLPFPPKPSPAARAVGAGASPARSPRSRLSLGSVLDWGGRRAGAEGERVSFPHPPSPQPRRPLWQGTSQGT